MKIIKENKFLHTLIYGNRMILICVFFTLATMFDVIFSLIFGGSTDHLHLASRFIIVTLIVFSLVVFRLSFKISIVAVVILHFLICVAVMVLYTWISGFFIELHPRAYYYMVRTIFIIYPVFFIGGIGISIYHKIKQNKQV